MHLYGHLLRMLPAPLAGFIFAAIYALLILAILALAALEPADFDYGRY